MRPITPMTGEQLDFLTEQTERAAQKAVKKFSRKATAGFVILLAGLGLALSQIDTIGDLDKRDVRFCQRLNIVRAQSNVSDSVSFNILSASAQRERELIKRDPQNAALHRESTRDLSSEAGKLTVVALTDCSAARDPRYDYPVADPLGNPRTGELGPNVKEILEESSELLEKRRVGNG